MTDWSQYAQVFSALWTSWSVPPSPPRIYPPFPVLPTTFLFLCDWAMSFASLLWFLLLFLIQISCEVSYVFLFPYFFSPSYVYGSLNNCFSQLFYFSYFYIFFPLFLHFYLSFTGCLGLYKSVDMEFEGSGTVVQTGCQLSSKLLWNLLYAGEHNVITSLSHPPVIQQPRCRVLCTKDYIAGDFSI